MRIRALEELPLFGEFDCKKEYDEAIYEAFISQFCPNQRHRRLYRFAKRGADLILAAALLATLAPLFLLIAVSIRIDSEGTVLFRQKRVGRNGREFICYKFRTMIPTAPSECPTGCLQEPERYVTRVGGLLRRLSLDELPQLWCVLRGTMSFIGYRPLIPCEECNGMRERLGVFSMRPGISGYAQVMGRDDVTPQNKAVLDACYVKHAGIALDLRLTLKTVAVVLLRKGNHCKRACGHAPAGPLPIRLNRSREGIEK